MLLSTRNTIFAWGIVLCSLSIVFIVLVSFMVLPVFSTIDTETVKRSAGLYNRILGHFSEPNFYAVYAAICLLALYSVIVVSLIFHYFEKTQSPEIVFIGFFVISLALEAARLMMPLQQMYEIPSLYIRLCSRILLFGRNFGIFALFAASLCAAGMKSPKQQLNLLYIIVGAAFIVAMGTPVDTFSWTTSFDTINGYASVYEIVDLGMLLITILSFLVAAYVRASREYVFIAVGSLLAFAGRQLLLNADTWIGLSGIVLLILGIWFICTRLHKVYLWL